MPISLVRWMASKDARPNKPRQAIAIATTEKLPNAAELRSYKDKLRRLRGLQWPAGTYEAAKAGAKTNFYLFAKDGYPPYGTTVVAMQKLVKEKPDLVARFVRASMEGWTSYLANPAPFPN